MRTISLLSASVKRVSSAKNCGFKNIMWNIVWLICATCSVALGANSAIKPSGKITITPNVIDLDSNVTFYTVSCQLDFVQEGLNSSSLHIEQHNEKIKSEIVNSTTIMAKQYLKDLKQDEECSTQSFRCLYENDTLETKEVYVGRLSAEIEFQRNFKCILFDLDEKYCEFIPVSPCYKCDKYRLAVTDGLDSFCNLYEKNGTCYYSSNYSNKSNCHFPIHDNVTLRLDAGSRSQGFTVNHDFIKIRDVPEPVLVAVTSDRVELQIILSNLKFVDRGIESQFQFISKYDARNNSTKSESYIVNYTMNNLHPFTEYKLGVRHRVIPLSQRLFEEEYWSDWSWSTFRTNARKPERAPLTVPGSYSIKAQKGDRATIEIYWESLPEFQWNGPGFRYNVSAVADSGKMYFPAIDSKDNDQPLAVANFEDLKLDHYRILVSCYNDEGSAHNTNILEVFPPNNDLKPAIKKVASDGHHYTVSWYPPATKFDPSNYTVMYCNKTLSSYCKDSIRFHTVSPTQTTFIVGSSTVLTFAVSANYRNHSSDFSWQQCLVSPTADIGPPQFNPCNITDVSFDIRMTTPCLSNSFYELYQVYVLAPNGTEIKNETFKQPRERIWIGDLQPDTEYTVKVVASDENGNNYETSKVVQTSPKYTTLQLMMFFCSVILALSALIMLATRKVNSLRNINVELPPALRTLLGEDADECKKILPPAAIESIERTPRIYVDLPSRGYNNIPIEIPEEDEEYDDEAEPEQCPEESEGASNGGYTEDATVLASVSVSVESQVQNKPAVQANGYVLAAQFMAPKERPAPQLPANVTSGVSSGYVMFK